MYEFKLRESEPFYSNLPEYLDWDIWEYVNGDDPIRFFAEDGMSPDDSITTRYPYYRMRGKPVTPEQAFEIYRRTAGCFSRELCLEGSIKFYLFPDGWICPGGEVLQNDHFQYKWATLREAAYDFIPLAYHFPFLEMITAVTYWNEVPPEDLREEDHSLKYFKYGKKDRRFFKEEPYDRSNFYDNIGMGIWLHDKRVEFIAPDRTAKLYREYDIFYKDKQCSPFKEDRSLTEKCLKAYGIENTQEYFDRK